MFAKLTGWLQGRTTAFISLFFITGNLAHFLHRLDGTYITFMGTLLGFVLGHSVSQNVAPGGPMNTGPASRN